MVASLSGILQAMPNAVRSTLGRRGIAVLPAIALLLGGAPLPAQAASGDLVVIAQSRYGVEPDAHRVHVTIDAVATSYTPDTPQGRTYYSGVNFAVQPAATNVSASAGGVAMFLHHGAPS